VALRPRLSPGVPLSRCVGDGTTGYQDRQEPSSIAFGRVGLALNTSGRTVLLQREQVARLLLEPTAPGQDALALYRLVWVFLSNTLSIDPKCHRSPNCFSMA
jgi:hypothetical protein